jgi:hypothetical protein
MVLRTPRNPDKPMASLNNTRSMDLNKEVTLRIKRKTLYAVKTKRDGI